MNGTDRDAFEAAEAHQEGKAEPNSKLCCAAQHQEYNM
jgi:hypothetical protein